MRSLGQEPVGSRVGSHVLLSCGALVVQLRLGVEVGKERAGVVLQEAEQVLEIEGRAVAQFHRPTVLDAVGIGIPQVRVSLVGDYLLVIGQPVTVVVPLIGREDHGDGLGRVHGHQQRVG